jgi:hypothetical protein
MGSTPPLLDLRPSLPPSGGDLAKIKNARGNLDGERKSQVKAAFSDLGKTTSLSNAQTQLQQAFQGLATSYRSTFAKIGCG